MRLQRQVNRGSTAEYNRGIKPLPLVGSRLLEISNSHSQSVIWWSSASESTCLSIPLSSVWFLPSQFHQAGMKQKKGANKNKEKVKAKQSEHVQLHRSMNVKSALGSANRMIDQLQSKMKGSKFRWINEQLYTQSGNASLEMVQKDSSLFDIYHQGFREQVTRWPLVPVDVFIKMLKCVKTLRLIFLCWKRYV